jgi:hypothetical protein
LPNPPAVPSRGEPQSAGAAKKISVSCHFGDFSYQHPHGRIARACEGEYPDSFGEHFGLEQATNADDDPVIKE